MWYPTLPELLQLHERICATQDVSAGVTDMAAVDEAILAPQRTGGTERRPEVIAMKTTLLLRPLLAHRPFEHCSSRVAYSMAQQFVNRNGFLFKTTMSAMQDRFRDALPDDEDPAHIASWVESNLESRFDTSHTNRMFRALNTLAEVKASLERVPGFHEEADRIDAVGHAIAYHIAALFRLDDDTKRALESKFPVFAAAWRDALDTDG